VWGLGTYTYAAYDPQEYQEDLDAAGQEISGSLGLRLTDTWSVLGSLRYDIENEQRLMDAIQVRYLDECFMLSVTYQETYLRNQDVEPDQTVMLRFELKHLGGYKYKTDVLDHVFGSDQPQ
jgi:LPS-assembly protein